MEETNDIIDSGDKINIPSRRMNQLKIVVPLERLLRNLQLLLLRRMLKIMVALITGG